MEKNNCFQIIPRDNMPWKLYKLSEIVIETAIRVYNIRDVLTAILTTMCFSNRLSGIGHLNKLDMIAMAYSKFSFLGV